MDPMAAIRQTFFQECDEQLAELESGLIRIDEGDRDPETVNAVFRAVHSIKGGASAFGFDDLVEFVHVFETTLDLLRSNRIEATQQVAACFLRASDVLADLVSGAREGSDVNPDKVAPAKAELQSLCEGAGSEGDAASEADFVDLAFEPVAISLDSIFGDFEESEQKPHRYVINFKPRPALYAKGNEALLLLRELGELGALRVTCNTDDTPFLDELDPEGAYFSWTAELETKEDARADIQAVFEFVEFDCDLSIKEEDDPPPGSVIESMEEPAVYEEEPKLPIASNDEQPALAVPEATPQPQPQASAGPRKTEPSSPAPQPTIRVDLERVDRLINLVGELVINQAVLSQRVSEAGLSRASSVMIALDELEQLTRDIQDSVMAIRAQPVKPIFQRMSRVVREVAAITKKSVRLITDGESTEVDKTVVERLTDPLTHMIRNAVDHGIESAEQRIAVGKPEEGTLKLSAMHRSGRVVIEVSDDGAGINRQRVRQIAVSKNLISPDALLTDEEIDNLIFAPGFSTTETASAISGRGVGMDVVKRAVQALGGRISIASRPGLGSTFSLSLPLTLAVLDGMVVTIGDQTFVVPLTAIVETMQPKKESVHLIGSGTRLIRSRDAFIPLVDVGAVLHNRPSLADPTAQVALLAESESGGRCALLVDEIQGQRQVVIKSLEANYGRVFGIAAGTILGDGRVALIIDVDGIINSLRADSDAVESLHAAE
ncbi:chemotaxis protein CheA [Methylocystis sp. MJC1]|jgi:two-component system chemotaxis sensor kinase CheA|uniref:chemotaxis protein CheA n=1 Tax=Methylocystis sp. MJC1 TaxID=2654282 RepID=UPI0013EA6A59|nr:chemotaxis protein CheA [Methylocystis sp. MJC1]KAF2990620.1 Chemotaxis protein CheA [Methylocystis sp. MJC1]MBU6525719.1 chemotaxis protein CheA [Methylocystis sp. MJC1]UZX12190.1 chemotaxis protein CheA [Methylocystis sp. MJC1]